MLLPTGNTKLCRWSRGKGLLLPHAEIAATAGCCEGSARPLPQLGQQPQLLGRRGVEEHPPVRFACGGLRVDPAADLARLRVTGLLQRVREGTERVLRVREGTERVLRAVEDRSG